MEIRRARASDAADLVRFINMAADDLPLHFWRKSVGPEGDPWALGRERAARETGNFSYRNAWLAEVDGTVAACLLGYAAEPAPGPVDPDTPPIFVPLLELEALAPGSWYLNVLATDDGFRGKGLGSALLAYAESVAAAAGRRGFCGVDGFDRHAPIMPARPALPPPLSCLDRGRRWSSTRTPETTPAPGHPSIRGR